MTYASNDDFEIKSYLKQEAYLSKALIGYHYLSSKVDFKVHVQPLTGISQRITHRGSSASISFRL